jgi:uncharacterized membrane protein YagU involved in acid resistance
MDKELHEQYEYARRRIRQKKRLYLHFVFFLLGSLFMIITHKFFDIGIEYNWHVWGITIWLFLFILHFIKVYITDRFMNKNWEREQIDRLVALQQKKSAQLQEQINEDTDK